MTPTPIKKAVFPVAGLGSRFLPATKAVAKEMLPIVDKPLVQYAVEEAVEAGCTDMVFVTGRTKKSIEDHFDTAVELEMELQSQQKTGLLELARNIIPANISCSFIRQSHPLGLGHAVLCARPIIGNEPFAVVLPDDLVDHEVGCLRQMVAARQKSGGSVIALQEVGAANIQSYGVVSVENAQAETMRINHIVEKPAPADAPSNLAVIGRYILQPDIFPLLEKTGRGAGGEIQLTDGIQSLARQQPVYGFRFQGTRYDCGSKLGFLEATVQYALKHPELAEGFKKYLAGCRV